MGRPEEAAPPPPPPLDGIESNDKRSHHTRSTPPQAFPPTNSSTQDYEDVPQMFPPPPPPSGRQDEIPHNFPPSQPSAPTHFHHHQPNNHQQPHFNQPAAAGLQTGYPAAPFMPPPPPNQLPTQAWRTGLFDCMQDPQNAIITACFPCVTFGQIAEIADSGTTSCATSGMWYSCIAFCIAMPCIMSCTYRTKMRAILGLVESPAPDWAVHCFCEWCALCQEYRELKERGYDPAIGWVGNMAIQQQKQHASMAPPMHQRMM